MVVVCEPDEIGISKLLVEGVESTDLESNEALDFITYTGWLFTFVHSGFGTDAYIEQ